VEPEFRKQTLNVSRRNGVFVHALATNTHVFVSIAKTRSSVLAKCSECARGKFRAAINCNHRYVASISAQMKSALAIIGAMVRT
jgi:hypothetical protein